MRPSPSKHRLLLVACLAFVGTGCSWNRGPQLPTAGLWDRMRPSFTRAKAEKASKDLKDAGGLYLAYAKWQEQVGQLVEARESYETALNKNPKSVDAILGLSRLDHLAGRTREAESGFQKARQLAPYDPHVLASAGQYYAANERWSEAVESLNGAVRAAPNENTYRYYLATALARSGDLEGAYPHFVQSVGEAAAHYNMGYMLYEAQQFAAAEQEFLKAVAQKPELSQAQQMLAEVRQKLQKDVLLADGASAPVTQQTQLAVNEQKAQPSWPVETPQRDVAQPTSAGPQAQARPVRQTPLPGPVQNPFAGAAAQPTGYPHQTPQNPFASDVIAQEARNRATAPTSTGPADTGRAATPVGWPTPAGTSEYRAVGRYRIPLGEQAQQAEATDPFSNSNDGPSAEAAVQPAPQLPAWTPQQREQLLNQINSGSNAGW